MIFTGAQLFPVLEWHYLIYGSLFKLYSFDLQMFHIDSYAWIVSTFGLLSWSFLKIWHWLNICQWIHVSSPQISLIGCPIMPPWFLGSGHSVDSVLAICAYPLGIHMHVVSTGIPGIVFGFLHLCYCIPCEPREFLWPQNVH